MSIKKFEIGPLATNCYIYTDDESGESVIIDPAFNSDKLIKEVENSNIKFILLTHAHIDHIMGLDKVKKITNAPIVANINEADRLRSRKSNLYDAFDCYEDNYNSCEIDIAVNDGDVINLGKRLIQIVFTPGHTDGSVCYIIGDTLFSGDTLFAGSYGRTDFEGGSFSNLIDSFYKLCSLEGDYMILPGHQNSTTLNDERNFNPLSRYI